MANSYSGSPCFTKKLGRNLWVQNDLATVLATTNIVQIKWGFNNGQIKFGAHILEHYLLV